MTAVPARTSGGNLVADAFAAAGGHQHQGVAARDDVADGGILLATETGKSEDLSQDLGGIGKGELIEHAGGGNLLVRWVAESNALTGPSAALQTP